MIIYHIGEFYRYTNSKKRFQLTEVNGFIFRFLCGHWCTDYVFEDLIRVKTNTQVCEETQLEIF